MTAEIENDALPEEIEPAAANDEFEEISKELAILRSEAETHKDRALRALAELENVRKRLERERDEARIYSVTRFARDMLVVADNLSRALSALTSERRETASESHKAVMDGVEATQRELLAALGRHGIKRIDAENCRFDPHLHQAIAEVPAQGKEPGTVIHVVQDGYTIGDRLLRPAMVTVAKAAGDTLPN
jgi:molecular chaperone GrpE